MVLKNFNFQSLNGSCHIIVKNSLVKNLLVKILIAQVNIVLFLKILFSFVNVC